MKWVNEKELHAFLDRLEAQDRYQKATTLILTLDQHRLLSQVGRRTYTDGLRMVEAQDEYNRTHRR